MKAWKNREGQVRKIGLITGAGLKTSDVKLALERGCDTYITGEKVLYTVQYAAFVGINLIVGSHTFTEIFRRAQPGGKAAELFPEISILQLPEAQMRSKGMDLHDFDDVAQNYDLYAARSQRRR